MFIKGLLLASASSILAGVALAQPQVLSLGELQRRCHEMESNDQILPFTSQFTCSEERTFWVHRGSKVIPLPNGAEVKIKALIKGNQHQTDWWTIPGHSQDQATSCDMYEQVRGIARIATTLKSCAELDGIVSEAEFCKGLLMRVWDDCAGDMSSGNIKEGHKGACEYIPTGVIRGCAVEEPTTSTSGTSVSTTSGTSESSTTVSAHVPSETTPSTTSSATSSSFVPPEPVAPVAPCFLGAQVAVVKGKDGMFNHRMVQLQDEPQKGSMLSKLGLHKGDVIAKVNGERVQNQEELDRALKAGRTKGPVTIKFKDQRGMLLERTKSDI
jgi:hypothetical protein